MAMPRKTFWRFLLDSWVRYFTLFYANGSQCRDLRWLHWNGLNSTRPIVDQWRLLGGLTKKIYIYLYVYKRWNWWSSPFTSACNTSPVGASLVATRCPLGPRLGPVWTWFGAAWSPLGCRCDNRNPLVLFAPMLRINGRRKSRRRRSRRRSHCY